MNNIPTISRFSVFKNGRRILENPLPFHKEKFQELGDTFKIVVSSKEKLVFTKNPNFIKHVLQTAHKKYQKSSIQTVDLAKYIGHGILTSNGDHWRTHRRMVQPAFHKKKLQNLMVSVLEAIQFELKRIEPNKTEDVFDLMGDLAFQVVAKSLFSSSDIRKRMDTLKYITETNQRMLIKEMRQPYLRWWLRLNGKIKKHLGLAKEAQALLGAIINERRDSGEEKDDLLDMLLQAQYEDGTPMLQQQLIDEVMILFAAGHETTANALSFTLFLLAKNPKIQEKIYTEVAEVDFNEGDMMQHIASLQYTKQCLEEAMRLYPPAYIIDRETIAEDVFEESTLPKNTLVLMSMYELHRHADFWENPEVYNPDRFNPENKKDYSGYYYPFGAGPRMCVGNHFAMCEMVLTVAEIMKKHTITSPLKAVEVNPLISLKPKEVPLTFKLRD